MTSGCCFNGGIDGLVSGHAYSLLDIKRVEGVVLAKMRNPWAKEAYKGPYRDNDPFWKKNPEAAAKVGLEKKNDGVFWMPYDNYVKYFNNFAVAIDERFKSH